MKKKLPSLQSETNKYVIDEFGKNSECSLENINLAFQGYYYILTEN